jgi:serine/threonine protein kinase
MRPLFTRKKCYSQGFKTSKYCYNGINGRFVKLADFGLSVYHEFNEQLHTQDSGTPKYMAPEVFASRKYDIKADIFSLGKIVKELFNIEM